MKDKDLIEEHTPEVSLCGVWGEKFALITDDGIYPPSLSVIRPELLKRPELLEGYEKESGGTEVNKQKLIKKWESVIEAAEFYGRGREDRLIEYMKGFLSDLYQLDEPETLSQKWLDEHTQHITRHGTDKDGIKQYHSAPFVSAHDLQNLLVPEQEKVEVPRFVAEWVEENRSKYGKDILEIGHDFYATDLDNLEVDDWVEINTEIFARAWLDGYTVEKEPRYYVLDKEGHLLLRGFSNGTVGSPGDKMKPDMYPDWNKKNLPLTEQEIKDYDERFWPFAVKVEEVEE